MKKVPESGTGGIPGRVVTSDTKEARNHQDRPQECWTLQEERKGEGWDVSLKEVLQSLSGAVSDSPRVISLKEEEVEN